MKLSLSHSLTASLIVASWLLSACAATSNPEAGALGTSGAEPALIALETSSQSITVTNNAGKPIEDVRVAIQPIGALPSYTSTLRRLENGEKRELSLAVPQQRRHDVQPALCQGEAGHRHRDGHRREEARADKSLGPLTPLRLFTLCSSRSWSSPV